MTKRFQLRVPLLRVFALVAASVILQGCVSYNWVGTSSVLFENPQRFTESMSSIRAGEGKPAVTAIVLEETWGAPDSVEPLGDGNERWTYNMGLRWNGVFLSVLIVPIPLLVPVGSEWVSFDISNGLVIAAFGKKDTFRYTALFGLYLGICNSGFGSLVDSDPPLVTDGTYSVE